ncbi:MAG: DUF2490 domain-containing protein [Bacteroidota bacterium]
MRSIHTLFLLLVFHTGWSQVSSVWLTAQAPVRLGNWEWHNDASYRTNEFQANAFQWFYRTGIRYYANDRWSTAAGFARFNTRDLKLNPQFQKENRIWEEVLRTDKTAKGMWMNRFRLEQRWFQSTATQVASFFWRPRYRLSYEWKLSDRWDLQLYDEYFFHLNRQEQKWNHNRLGFFFQFNRSSAVVLNLGYTWAYRPQGTAHLFMISFQQGYVDID